MVVSVTAQSGIATVIIDNPPVNATSQMVRRGLMEALAKIEADPAITAVVLSCAGRTFVAGADVTEFGKSPVEPHLPDVIDAIEAASKPWVAALHGTVLGGGLELAMGCHARIAANGTKLGLPEVNLGLIPGGGGTVRLPRLVTATKALEMVSGGKPIAAQAALDAGLIDEIAEGDLGDAAFSLAARAKIRRTMDNDRHDYDADAFDVQKRKFIAKARGQLSIVAATEAIERALTMPAKDARKAERETFLNLKNSEQSTALRHIFFAERKTLSDPRAKGPARPFDKIGIIGGGTMGAGIATGCLMRGLSVVLVEQTPVAAERARETITKNLTASAKRGLIKEPDATLARLTTADSYSVLKNVDLVIEAVFENMDVKKQVFQQIEAETRPDAIIATNTSYLDVNEIASVLSDPSRAIGLHFFSPAHIMKLLEIVLPNDVADDVVATAAQFGNRLGKIGVFAGVCDGFEMQDLAGLDISWAMRKRRIEESCMPDDYIHIADRLCEAGRFGRKTKAGWYDYDETGASPSAIVTKAISEERGRKGITPREFTEQEIMQRILARMKSEAKAVQDEGISQSVARWPKPLLA